MVEWARGWGGGGGGRAPKRAPPPHTLPRRQPTLPHPPPTPPPYPHPQDKNIKHSGNISLDDVYEIARVMRDRSCAASFAGTVKEMLGTAVSGEGGRAGGWVEVGRWVCGRVGWWVCAPSLGCTSSPCPTPPRPLPQSAARWSMRTPARSSRRSTTATLCRPRREGSRRARTRAPRPLTPAAAALCNSFPPLPCWHCRCCARPPCTAWAVAALRGRGWFKPGQARTC